MARNPVRVTIINDPLKKQDCEMACGTDWASLQVLDITRKQLAEKFGERVQLLYMDVTLDSSEGETIKWAEEIKRNNFSVPLLLLNGQVRISGNFDIRQLMDAVEVEMEMGV